MDKGKTFQRIDEETMLRVLEGNKGTITEVILRLAWCVGLLPEEMHELMWSEVDLKNGVIHLPERSVPIDEKTWECLQERYNKPFSKSSRYVIISELRRVHMSRIYIFRYAKEALTKGGLTGVTLMSLRNDFIVRQLEQHGKSYVAKIAGVTVSTLNSTFVPQMKTKYQSKRPGRMRLAKVDAQEITELILREGPTPAGLALWMTWKHQMLLTKDILPLTWNKIDFKTGSVFLDGRRVSMDNTLEDWLLLIRAERTPEDDPHVLLTPKSRRPYDGSRLSRITKEALIKGGLDQLSLRDLYFKGQYVEKEALLFHYVKIQGYITREEAMNLLRLEKVTAWECLHRLVQEAKLVRVGTRYYLPGTVVPPEQHYEVVRAYLKEVGGAYRKELAALLGVEERQGGTLLSGMVAEGKLNRTGQWYTLADEET